MFPPVSVGEAALRSDLSLDSLTPAPKAGLRHRHSLRCFLVNQLGSAHCDPDSLASLPLRLWVSILSLLSHVSLVDDVAGFAPAPSPSIGETWMEPLGIFTYRVLCFQGA